MPRFDYGPTPADWKFRFIVDDKLPWADYAREFWDMIDHPEYALPGGWVEF